MRFAIPTTLPGALQAVIAERYSSAISGVQAPPDIPLAKSLDLGSMLAALRGHHGTVTAAAKAAGIDRRTWQRIAGGRVRRPASAGRIRAAYDLARPEMVRQRDAQIRISTGGAWWRRKQRLLDPMGYLLLDAVLTISKTTRRRRIQLAGHLTARTRGEVIDAVRDGRPVEAARLFIERGLIEDYGIGHSVGLGEIHELDWR